MEKICFCESKKDSGAKGQAAMEYLMMVGVLLTVIAAISGYALFMYYETTANNQIQTSLKDLRDGVNQVYSLGEGNVIIVNITLPSGVTNAHLTGKAIYMTATTFGSDAENIVEVNAPVSGTIPTASGVHEIAIANHNGVVTLNEI